MASNTRGASIGLGGLLVVGLVTAISLTRCGGDDGRLATVSSTQVPETTAEPTSRSTIELNISDEPIRIDADGTITAGTALLGTIASDDQSTGTNTLSSAPTTADEVDDGLNLLGGDDPEDRLMPDVVCMGLQRAQDEIQDHGVFGSKSSDATGAGRRQIWDRNWIVVDQDPAPGEPIGEFDATLFVVKNDEQHPC